MSEMDKLEEYIKAKGLSYKRIVKHPNAKGIDLILNRNQLVVYKSNNTPWWSAVCHFGSYGYDQGLIEVMGDAVVKEDDGDTIVGFLTAEDVIARFESRNN